MSDDKSKTTKQDRIRVDVNDSSEIEYLQQQFPSFSREQIVEIIKQKGPLRADILAYLGKMK